MLICEEGAGHFKVTLLACKHKIADVVWVGQGVPFESKKLTLAPFLSAFTATSPMPSRTA